MSRIKNVIVCLSGGVDSAVAACLLKSKGYNLTGVYMRNWDLVDETGFCNSNSEAEDAQFVCDKLKIPFMEVNFVKEYWNEVFTVMLNDYQQGLTPNPDILCNSRIKFGSFLSYALNNLKCDAIATGHYARNSFGPYLDLAKIGSNAKLLKAKDPIKDQTFFLSQINQYALQHTMFPIGDKTKEEVKRMAVQNGLSKIAKKKESMGICFIGNRNFKAFMEQYVKPCKGLFIDIDSGKPVGSHTGKHNWTYGQKCKLGGMPEPYYISRKTLNQDIIVAKGHEHPSLYCTLFQTEKPVWVDSEPLALSQQNVFYCDFRFQHTNPLVSCKIIKLSDNNLLVRLNKNMRALTPGQYAVFYNGDECVGSARISNLGPSVYFQNFKYV